MVDRLPAEMKELMTYLDHECVILRHHAGSMGWSIDFQIKETDLSLIYDRGSLVLVKDPKGKGEHLSPEGMDWTEVSMRDLANEVNNEFA